MQKRAVRFFNSAKMTLEEVLEEMFRAEETGLVTVRLHTGDPCVYGAIREPMDVLDEKGISMITVPGSVLFAGRLPR